MNFLIKTLKISFVIIGTVLGAGFLSGKEIYEFFYGQDIIISTVIIFVVFFLITFFLLKFDLEKQSKIYKFSKIFLFLGNFVIMCGMLSAIDSLFTLIFPWSKTFPIFSIITIIISNIVMFGGTKSLKTVNTFLVPIIIFVIVFMLFIPSDKVIVPTGTIKPFKIASYSGLNLFLAVPVLITLGRKEKTSVCLVSSLISSLVLALLIFGLFTCVSGCDKSVTQSDMPVLKILSYSKILYVIYVFVLYFGILTTLLSAHYPLFNYFSDGLWGNVGRVILTLSAVLFSKIGFYNIVSKVYPVIGGIGFVVILIFAVEIFFFRKVRR